jgi:uncharacterized protein
LNADEKAALESRLTAWSNSQRVQLQIVILNTLREVSIEEFSIKLAEKFQWGEKGTDRGVLFLISVSERKLRIEVGRGLEGQITDAHSARIIRSLKNYLREQQYFAAMVLLSNSIYELAENELPTDQLANQELVSSAKGSKSFSLKDIIVILFFAFVVLASLLQRFLGINQYQSRRSSGHYPGMFGGSGSSWGGGGGGGGGGWSGGGGGFSGGGASGDW